jgi:hypothetical protein
MAAPLKLERVVRVDDDTWRPFNMASFDQDKVRTFGDYQYTPYWDADKTLVVARRDLRDNSVQTVRLEGRTLTINPNDGHRNTVVGVSEQDGRLHLSWDHHCNQLRYGTSRPGFVTNPPETIRADDFEPPRPLIPDNKLESTATYPRFLSNPPEALHFIYRQGGSGNGDNYVQRYDAKTHTWSRLGEIGLFSRRGTYAPWQNSTSRCAYLNDTLLDTKGRLHVTWCYRETGATWASNHDLHYAYSDDSGATWYNNTGQLIADLPNGDPIELADPGIVVKEIPVFSWLMNQCTMTLDADNQPHVVNFHLATPEKPKGKLEHSPPREIGAKLQLFHYWRTPDGKWHDSGPVTHLATRPGIVFDKAGNLVVYYANGGKLKVHVARKSSNWQDWEHATVDVPGINLRAASKPDLGRMKRDGVLSFAVTTNEDGGKRGFALVDFRLTPNTTASLPKAFRAEPTTHASKQASVAPVSRPPAAPREAEPKPESRQQHWKPVVVHLPKPNPGGTASQPANGEAQLAVAVPASTKRPKAPTSAKLTPAPAGIRPPATPQKAPTALPPVTGVWIQTIHTWSYWGTSCSGGGTWAWGTASVIDGIIGQFKRPTPGPGITPTTPNAEPAALGGSMVPPTCP